MASVFLRTSHLLNQYHFVCVQSIMLICIHLSFFHLSFVCRTPVTVTSFTIPIVSTVRPACTKDSDCDHNEICRSQKCKNVCDDCGVNANCRVINRRVVCSCPQGYEGIPTVQCVKGERVLCN